MNTRRLLVLITLSLVTMAGRGMAPSNAYARQAPAPESGFTADASALERSLEARFVGRKNIDVRKYGAKADAQSDENCTMSARSTALICEKRNFGAADVGKVISIKGAAAGQRQLITVIAGYVDPERVTLRDESLGDVSHTGIIWGTDNLIAFQTALNAAAGQSLIIPPGGFLIKVSAKVQLEVPSDTLIAQQKGGTLYMVGVSGAPRGDASIRLFHLPENTHDVLIDGLHCSGEDFPYSLVPMNQSECIGGVGVQPEALRDITVMRSTFENLYGFSVHDAGTGLRFHAIGNYFSHTSKGININADYSNQVENVFEADGGLEASGSNSNYSDNRFHNCTGQYTMSLGGRTTLPAGSGSVAEGNVIDGLSTGPLGAISVANGFNDGIVSGNRISGLRGLQIGINLSHSNYPAGTDGNLIANNEIEGIAESRGIIVGGGVHSSRLERNRTAGTMYGAIISGSQTRSHDNLWSGSFRDLAIVSHGNEARDVEVKGDVLINGSYEIIGQATVTKESYVVRSPGGQEIPLRTRNEALR